jgi:hypothetical protein
MKGAIVVILALAFLSIGHKYSRECDADGNGFLDNPNDIRCYQTKKDWLRAQAERWDEERGE